jgi:hypothetical protein
VVFVIGPLNESFATLGFARDDRWGLSFTGVAGGTQAIIFHAVPELSTLGLALVAGLALALGRSRENTPPLTPPRKGEGNGRDEFFHL